MSGMSDNSDYCEDIDSGYLDHFYSKDIIKYETSVSPFQFNTITPDIPSSLIIKFIEELLQELSDYLLNTDVIDYDFNMNDIINNYSFDYDLDPKSVLKFMTSSSQSIFYSSLIGYFYQYGIGCKINEVKALEIFSNAIRNNQKAETNQFPFDQENEPIAFCNDNIKNLNEMLTQYFYCLLLYKDIIILNRENNYKLYIKNAEKGDNESQYYIGDCYFYGRKIEHNYNKAIEWFSKSSEGGNIRAMFMLGTCYYFGSGGVMKDKKKAFEFYLKAAEGGHRIASHLIGNRYNFGEDILKDKSKAFEFYLRAAENGNFFSQYIVGIYYNHGKYIPKDEDKGFYWNRKAAISSKYTPAQYILAEYYLNNNESKAFRWCLKLADKDYKDNLWASYLVAKCYRDGIGTEKNSKEAATWFEKYTSGFYKSHKSHPITTNDFLNGSVIPDCSGRPKHLEP
ncbi:hypothetical protein C1645_836301 [Glomus cerebriforme]|uniref:HCP-like protein n=1 Tax=Glomus cerebriforme TaxID=658196 RepID=A0A397S8N8_9GLOM|nr:hypothetical protein C1645_836301 [Glomus cerebriforme]